MSNPLKLLHINPNQQINLTLEKTSALVLLSGGLDSAVALYWAKNKGYSVETITFCYFLRSPKEIESCKKIAKSARVKNTMIKLEFLKEIEDLKGKNRNPLLKNAPSAYIPVRNIIFYGIASSIAEAADVKYVIGGHNKNDSSSFPDSSQRFFDLFNKTASLGKISKSRTGKVILPLAKLDKNQVVKLGMKLNVPFELTWSCYKSASRPCGKCPACLLRAEAFATSEIADPLMAAT